jgi:hypothetical protein
MKRRSQSVVKGGASLIAAGALTPMVALLAAYLYVGACGGGKTGFVLALRAGKIAVRVAWCEASGGGA